MYKKFLSLTLLVSIVYPLSANELEASQVGIAGTDEIATSNNLENNKIDNIVVEGQEMSTQNTSETQPNEAVMQQEMVETPVAEESIPVVSEQKNEEISTLVIKPNVKEISYNFEVTSKAAEMLDSLSEDAKSDFNDFSKELGKNLLEMPEVEDFITKHSIIYDEYKKFKGEAPKISVNFFILGDQSAEIISAKIDENNAKFLQALSEENKPKFKEAKQDLDIFLKMALDFTLFKITNRKFPVELIELDKNQELMVNITLD